MHGPNPSSRSILSAELKNRLIFRTFTFLAQQSRPETPGVPSSASTPMSSGSCSRSPAGLLEKIRIRVVQRPVVPKGVEAALSLDLAASEATLRRIEARACLELDPMAVFSSETRAGDEGVCRFE